VIWWKCLLTLWQQKLVFGFHQLLHSLLPLVHSPHSFNHHHMHLLSSPPYIFNSSSHTHCLASSRLYRLSRYATRVPAIDHLQLTFTYGWSSPGRTGHLEHRVRDFSRWAVQCVPLHKYILKMTEIVTLHFFSRQMDEGIDHVGVADKECVSCAYMWVYCPPSPVILSQNGGQPWTNWFCILNMSWVRKKNPEESH